MIPTVPRTDTGIINRAEQARDEIYRWMEEYCRQRGIETRLLKSTPYNPSTWVECFAWKPEDPARTCTDRSFLQVYVRAAPFQRYELLYDVNISVGDAVRKHTSVAEFHRNDLERMLDLAFSGDLKQIKECSLLRLRDYPWQIWRPKNKITPLDEPFIELTSALNFLAVIALMAGAVTGGLSVVVAVALWVAVWFVKDARERRRWQFQNPGKPLQEPRNLHRLDSWQTLVFEIGPEVGNVRQEILAELRKGSNSGFLVETERIWYLGLDGKEERDQIVARFRRGIAFIQIYAYGQDLFVGWDAHINSGAWLEKEVARGFQNGRMVSLRTIVSGSQPYTEYDLFDTNCLVEWVHGTVVKIVKRKMAYHRIDQEVDFKIIRGERKADTSVAAAEQKPVRKLFRRVE
jgi:hypothetical protein